jgi:predicted small lipoprotein YifL
MNISSSFSSGEDGGWKMEDGRARHPSSMFHLPFSLFIALMLVSQLCSCRTANPLPPADFSAPGWRVQQGQAVWKPAKNRHELVGDLLLATNADGNFFVQFSKNPFPLVTVQISGDRWQIEFGADEHAWRGRGATPERFVWFQLPRALMAGNVSRNWQFERVTTNAWRLANSRTGETLEGKFFP